MNDFLKSLRANKDRRFDRNQRKPYNNGYSGNRGNERGNERVDGNLKNAAVPGTDYDRIAGLIEENLPAITAFLTRWMETGEKMVAAEERKAAALERLAETLRAIPKSIDPAAVAAAAEPSVQETPGENSVNHLERDAVLNIIFSMRDDNATYGEIAARLENENIPTFSGKGKWHAQTIHRVCQERK